MKSNKSLVNMLLLVLSVVMTIFLCVCCAGFSYHTKKEETDYTEKYMINIAEKSADIINEKIDGYFSSLNAISSMISCYPDSIRLNADMLKSQLKLNEFRRIGYVYADGKSVIVDRELGELSGMDFRNRTYFKEAMKGTEYIADPFKDVWTGQSIVILSVPIYRGNKIIGVLCGVNNADVFRDVLESSCAEKDSYFHIVNANGDMLIRSSFANSEIHSNNIFTAKYERSSYFDRLRSDFAASKSGIARFKEYRQPEKYVAYAPLEANNWYVSFIIPASIISHRSNLILFFTILLMTALVATIASWSIVAIKSWKKSTADKYALSFQDKLTGCCNKAKFLFDLQAEDRLFDGNHFMVVYDIQNFTAFNKVFGYHTGDQLVVAIGKILNNRIEDHELLARSYADRFVLLLQGESGIAITQRINAIFDDLNDYMDRVGKSGYSLVARCGIYKIRPEDKSVSPDTFIDYANQARAEIGETYKSSLRFFNAEEDRAFSQSAILEAHMHMAIQNKEFLLYLQPKYSISGETPVLSGAESLVRWNYKGERFITPDQFIPKFEKNGFVTELDMYMLEQTCKTLRKWLDTGQNCVPISVNQSRLHMFNPEYLSKVLKIVDQYRIPHFYLDFEITESAMINDGGQVRDQFHKLRELGFSTSMDDFGSGFSSLHLLKDIEADTIKIDKGFFSESFHTESGQYIVQSVISLTKGLGYHVIAEGIETQQEVDFIKACGCDGVQGYYFGKPQPVSEFEQNHLLSAFHDDSFPDGTK